MSNLRAQNPTSGSSLLDRSKATPGSVNMAIFEKKTAAGQGTVNSNYLQQTREDNPEPVADQTATTVTLSNCKINTDPEKLSAEQPFEMSVDIKGPDGSTSGTVTFNLFCCIPKADGTETVEDESSPATGTVKDGSAVAKGTLVSPKDPVAAGTKLKYYVVAQHANATEKAESPKIEVEAGKTPEPLAVWCLGSVHFGFGSSFIMPSVASELASLKKLHNQNPDAGYAVFGHADPIGEDDFNKTLSGRRANAVYCLLTKNADGWVQLSKGVEGDKWNTKANQTILAFLKDDSNAPFYSGAINGTDDSTTKAAIESYQRFAKLKPNGIIDQQTKAKLYAAYMDKLSEVTLKPEDFVGDPKDAKLQWACSGCSEFNPMLVFSKADDDTFKSSQNKAERNAKNALNRRATVFQFPSGTKGPGNVTFPCPTWTDNSSKCKANWFSDGDTRRKPTDSERTWEGAKDTFACKFYSAIAAKENQITNSNPDANYVDISIFGRHFVDGHHVPNMANDEFLAAISGIAEFHDKHEKCALDVHPKHDSSDRDLLTQRLNVVESILHNDENVWCDLMKNATTQDIQNFMKYFVTKGWRCDPGPIDGVDGPRTKAAVKEFQESCNFAWDMSLAADGICGPKTWAAILKVIQSIITLDKSHSVQNS